MLTTHYLEEANALCDRVAILDRGALRAIGTPAELRAKILRGAHRLEVRLAPGAPNVASSLDARVAFGVDDGGKLVFTGEPERLWEVVDRLRRDAGAYVLELAFQQPTLDDVFLQLTAEEVSRSTSDGPARGASR